MARKNSVTTRSDVLREERKQRSQERVQRAAGPGLTAERPERARTRDKKPASAPSASSATRVVRPVQPPPPVMSRGGFVGTPVHKKSNSKVRRQYYYSLSTPGAEIRLPSMPAINFGWRGVSAMISLILLAAIFALWNAPQFQIDQVRVFGAQRISGDEILDKLYLEGLPVVEANPVEIRETVLSSFPDLEAVTVQVGLPARLVVSVQERVPVLAWEQEGKLIWIDAQGFAFEPRGDPGLVLPLIRAEGAPPAPPVPAPADGEEASPQAQAAAVRQTPFMMPELIQPMLDLSTKVPAGQAVSYSPQYGLGWTDPQGWQVYFGKDVSDIDLKLKQYQVIVDELSKRGLRPNLISVEFLHAPFYRLEQ